MRQFELIGACLESDWRSWAGGRTRPITKDANGQFEINWTFADALVTADRPRPYFPGDGRQANGAALGWQVSFAPKPSSPVAHPSKRPPTCTHSLWYTRRPQDLFHEGDGGGPPR